MKIQSLSIVVPTKNRCVNNCKFCVSRTHTNPYDDRVSKFIIKDGVDINTRSYEYKDYFNRLQFARDNGCNVVVLTGTGEPTQNFPFLKFFSYINSKLTTPFKSIEIQSTGVLLDSNRLYLLREYGVTTISLSISNIFDNNRNLNLINVKEKLKFNLYDTISLIKEYNFNLRLSLNLVKDYDKYSVEDVIKKCKELDADQVTFRKLYKSETNSEIDKWIEENESVGFYDLLLNFIKDNGIFLGNLPFGASIYDIDEMSVVVDDNCMSGITENYNTEAYKYLILRENAKLYSKWETKASLIF